VLRVGYIFQFFLPTYLEAEDQLLYIALAQSILQEGIWPALVSERTLGYPIILAGIFHIFGSEYFLVVMLQALIDSFTCLLIGLLAVKILQKNIGVFAGILSAFNLNMIVLSSMALTETSFLFLFTLSNLLLAHFILEKKSKYLYAGLAFLALSTMVRSASYYLLPLTLFYLLLLVFLRDYKFSKLMPLFAVSTTIIGIILLPQHLHNWDENRSTDFVSQKGTHILGWVVPAVYQYSGMGSYHDGQKLAHSRLEGELKKEGLISLPNDPFEASRYKVRVAYSIFEDFGYFNILKSWTVGALINMLAPSAAFSPAVRAMEHPSFYATQGSGIVEKLWFYITGSGSLYLLILSVGTITSLIFFSFFLLGWYLALRNKEKFQQSILIFFTMQIAYFVLITGPIIGSKYRLPIEPIMTVFIAYAISYILDKRKINLSLFRNQNLIVSNKL